MEVDETFQKDSFFYLVQRENPVVGVGESRKKDWNWNKQTKNYGHGNMCWPLR